MTTFNNKQHLLAILSGTTCPTCDREKAAYVWTCPDCYRPHQYSAEHQALSDSCDLHMDKAHEFLMRVKAAKQQPESD